MNQLCGSIQLNIQMQHIPLSYDTYTYNSSLGKLFTSVCLWSKPFVHFLHPFGKIMHVHVPKFLCVGITHDQVDGFVYTYFGLLHHFVTWAIHIFFGTTSYHSFISAFYFHCFSTGSILVSTNSKISNWIISCTSIES